MPHSLPGLLLFLPPQAFAFPLQLLLVGAEGRAQVFCLQRRADQVQAKGNDEFVSLHRHGPSDRSA